MTQASETKRPSISPGDLVRLNGPVRLRDMVVDGGEPVDVPTDATLMYLGMNDPSDMGDTLALVMGMGRIMEVHPARLRRAD